MARGICIFYIERTEICGKYIFLEIEIESDWKEEVDVMETR